MNIRQAIQILELEKFSGIDDLKKCFRAKAHLYHPDKNTNHDTSERFRNILTAYEYALKNISDVFKYFGVEEQPEDEETVKVVINNLDDIFEDIFGFSKGGRILGYQEPQVVYLSLKEFALGTKKREKLVAHKKCAACDGVGAQAKGLAKVCTYCFGHGTIRGTQNKRNPRICPVCKGRGRKITRVCTRCDGFGRLKQFHLQEITLPVGLQPCEVYTLESYDLENKGPSEVFIEPRLLRDPIFQIDKYDLLCEYHLDFGDPECNRSGNLLTPLGKAPMIIPDHAQDGDTIRLSGCGLYRDARRQQRGDLLVRLRARKKGLLQRLFSWRLV